jgi:23S rRNA C2498 (ribose-2'-O)-methylase RlmM
VLVGKRSLPESHSMTATRHKREFTVDAPSRSALVLAETLERAFGKRKWLSGKRLVGKYNRSDIQ